MKQINAIIRLRRDNETNFNKIKDSFIPANGEVVLVDTSNGLRAKIGDGKLNYGKLPFTESSNYSGVVNGYLDQNIFYTNPSKIEVIPNSIGKIYVDNAHSKIYYYDGSSYVNIQDTLTLATDEIPGVVKLYNTLGYNTDGTITQKLFTNEIESRYKTSIQSDEELLIFSL